MFANFAAQIQLDSLSRQHLLARFFFPDRSTVDLRTLFRKSTPSDSFGSCRSTCRLGCARAPGKDRRIQSSLVLLDELQIHQPPRTRQVPTSPQHAYPPNSPPSSTPPGVMFFPFGGRSPPEAKARGVETARRDQQECSEAL